MYFDHLSTGGTASRWLQVYIIILEGLGQMSRFCVLMEQFSQSLASEQSQNLQKWHIILYIYIYNSVQFKPNICVLQFQAIKLVKLYHPDLILQIQGQVSLFLALLHLHTFLLRQGNIWQNEVGLSNLCHIHATYSQQRLILILTSELSTLVSQLITVFTT